MKKYYYITTTLPYINASPHIGFAMEIVRTDAIARLHRLIGDNVFFNTGTDEHGQKIYLNALKNKLSPKEYADKQVKKFKALKKALNLSYDRFIRTTDSDHILAAQTFWQQCLKNNDIYKAKYKIKYCVGCELEKTDSELINNQCPIHPNQKIQIIEEENYFFRFSKYQNKLLNFYQNNPEFILPKFRFQELINFVKKGLKDFSISRLKEKMPWGIPIPNDPNQVMYVWFDALVNYISTLGWPKNKKKFESYWPGVQIAGKDNLRQQGAMWQAMLIAAGLPPSKKIYIEGFITADGQKMSKSLGNVIDPFELVKEYGVDAVRYYLLKEIPNFEDGDFSKKRMNELYTSNLANELGNLVSRLTNLAQKDQLVINKIKPNEKIYNQLVKLADNFQFNLILNQIWREIKKLNKEIDIFSPWKKKVDDRRSFLEKSLIDLNLIGQKLLPFLPTTGEKIIKITQGKIIKSKPLFPQLR